MEYSALIPAFNAAATIEEAIRSIVEQDLPPAEILVVDDGSTDGTGELAAAMDRKVRLVRQENRGVGAATSLGIRAASSPVIACLDADDIWLPSKMTTQIAQLTSNPDCHGLFTHLRTFRNDDPTDLVSPATPGWSRTTLAVRREAALEIGDLIDPPGGGSRGDMIDWIARGRHFGIRFDMIDAVYALRRIRPGSLSYGRDHDKDKGYARVAWLALQRRRGKA